MSRAHGSSFDARNRRVLAAQEAQAAASDVAADARDVRITAVEDRVTVLEDAPAPTTGNLVRTVLTLTLADVIALGAVTTGEVELSPDLPAGSHIINGTFRIVTPFVSSTPVYDLEAVFFWRAADSVAPDAIPLDSTPKTGYRIGSDTTPLVLYDSMGAVFINDSAFGANSAPYRWPYTPTPVLTLNAMGGTPNLDTYTAGELEIVILSVTMI